MLEDHLEDVHGISHVLKRLFTILLPNQKRCAPILPLCCLPSTRISGQVLQNAPLRQRGRAAA